MGKKKLSLEELEVFARKEMTRSAYASKDWGRGWAHAVRLKGYLDELLSCTAMPARLVRLLKVAILVHDIRWEQGGNHATAAAKLLDTLEIKGVQECEQADVRWAVLNHSRCPTDLARYDPSRRRDVLLWHLMLLDRMDAMGLLDIFRTIDWQVAVEKRMDSLGEVPAKELRAALTRDQPIAYIGDVYLKEESYLGYLVCSYLNFRAIFRELEPQLGEGFCRIVRAREQELGRLIARMLACKENNLENHKKEEAVFF